MLAASLKKFSAITLFLCVYTYGIMVLGPLVRAENAGLACPDWPLCYGHVIPPVEYRVYLEFIHRVVAGVGGIFLLLWIIWIFSSPDLRKRFSLYAVAALLLLAVQIFLGRWTVTKLLDAYVVKSHLLTAVIYLSVLLTVWVKARGQSLQLHPAQGRKQSLWVAGIFSGLVFLQLFLGGRVSTTGSGLSCNEFPACTSHTVYSQDGSSRTETVFFPPMVGALEMHMTHRLAAYLIFFFAVFLLFFSRSQQWPESLLKWNLGIFLGVCFQIMLGAMNVLFMLPVIVTVLHSASAIAIFAASFLQFQFLRTGQS